MNLDELSDGNYQSVKGSWISKNGKGRITFDKDGLSFINGKDAKEKSQFKHEDLKIFNQYITIDTTLNGRFNFHEISKGTLSGNLEYQDGSSSLHTFIFIPRGIDFKDSDLNTIEYMMRLMKLCITLRRISLLKETANTSKVDNKRTC